MAGPPFRERRAIGDISGLIGAGTNIDNLALVGHNVVVGRQRVAAGRTGTSGARHGPAALS